MNVIECKGLTKVYGSTKALNNLSCVIEEYKITGVIGRNGAGKTTLLKIIAGWIKESAGEIKVFAKHPFNNLMVSAGSIFIYDGMTLPQGLNLREILEEGARFYQNWDKELASRLFDYFSLHPLQYYSDLSKGMKSTFLMIFGIASRCPLTIFDEPTTGMDQAVRNDFYRALLKDYLAYPRTILISSHHLNEIEDLLEYLLLLDHGKEKLHMPIEEFSQYAISISGNRNMVDEWTANREVIYTKSYGSTLSAVVENQFSKQDMQKAMLAGLDISPVTPSDLCVYLTGKTKGGIDDVFNER